VRQIGDDGLLILFYLPHCDSMPIGRAYWMVDGVNLNPSPSPGDG